MATTINLNVDAGATFVVEFEYTNEDGSLFDLTGYTALMQIRDMPTAPNFVLQIVPTLNVTFGLIIATLSAAQTSTLTNSSYVYAIELYSGQTVIRPVQGRVIVSPEIVRS
jgi:hypothetical protein